MWTHLATAQQLGTVLLAAIDVIQHCKELDSCLSVSVRTFVELLLVD
jgi:hypothetical protein